MALSQPQKAPRAAGGVRSDVGVVYAPALWELGSWFQALGVPSRVEYRTWAYRFYAIPENVAPPPPETVTLDKWFVGLAAPVMVGRRPLGYLPFSYPALTGAWSLEGVISGVWTQEGVLGADWAKEAPIGGVWTEETPEVR
jgi:hypothetical protein